MAPTDQTSGNVEEAKHALRLSLSLTDVLFLIVLLLLVYTQLQNLFAGNVVAGLFVLQQVTTIIVMLLHRPPQSGPASRQDILLAWGGTLLPLAMQPTDAAANPVGGLLVLVGLVLTTGAILSLGRSFGIEAANRGIQTKGLYRFVRHPIYAAYLPLMGGFLIAFPSWWNGVLFVVWMGCQVARIRREEAVLGEDATCCDYAVQVRWRLIPEVW